MTPSSGVSPQTVSFDASDSRPDTGGAAIASYEWDFGNGTSGGGVTPSRQYTSPDTYTVRLTVTDTAGASATTTRTLPIRAFVNPPDFRLTGSQPELARDGKFFFAWTNVGASPGDTVTYKISVKVVEGCLAFGEKSRTVSAGAAGSSQTYTFTVGWPFSNVCAGSQYAWRVETTRVNAADGTRTTDATPWKHFWV
jgi:PKD repeat protein